MGHFSERVVQLLQSQVVRETSFIFLLLSLIKSHKQFYGRGRFEAPKPQSATGRGLAVSVRWPFLEGVL